MAAKERFAVQTFIGDRKGDLQVGRLIRCDDAAEACRVAAQKVDRGEALGAAAFSRTVTDPEYDDGEEPITLASFGRVPAGVRDQIPF